MSKAIVLEAIWKVPLLRLRALPAACSLDAMQELTDETFEEQVLGAERPSSSISGRRGAAPARRWSRCSRDLAESTRRRRLREDEHRREPRDRIALRRARDPDGDPLRRRRGAGDVVGARSRSQYERAWAPGSASVAELGDLSQSAAAASGATPPVSSAAKPDSRVDEAVEDVDEQVHEHDRDADEKTTPMITGRSRPGAHGTSTWPIPGSWKTVSMKIAPPNASADVHPEHRHDRQQGVPQHVLAHHRTLRRPSR